MKLFYLELQDYCLEFARFLKRSHRAFFAEDIHKNCLFQKFSENPQKSDFSKVLLSNLSCSNLSPTIILKTDSTANFSVSVPRLFKIAGTASVLESLFSEKTDEFPAFYNSVRSSTMCSGILQISRNSQAYVYRLQNYQNES